MPTTAVVSRDQLEQPIPPRPGSSAAPKCPELALRLTAYRTEARRFARNFVSINAAGDADRLIGVGFAGARLLTLRERYRARGASIEQWADLASDKLLDWITLAGAPDDVGEASAENLDAAERLDFERVIVAVPRRPTPPKGSCWRARSSYHPCSAARPGELMLLLSNADVQRVLSTSVCLHSPDAIFHETPRCASPARCK